MRSLFRRLVNYNDPNSYASRLRARRVRRLLNLIEATHAERGQCAILDVGGTVAYWRIVPAEELRRFGVHIHLLNLAAVPVPESVSDIFTSMAGDGCNLANTADHSYDIVHSNSVIEHVGAWAAMERMANEVRRVGRTYYLQTPYFWFPIEHPATPPLFSSLAPHVGSRKDRHAIRAWKLAARPRCCRGHSRTAGGAGSGPETVQALVPGCEHRKGRDGSASQKQCAVRAPAVADRKK